MLKLEILTQGNYLSTQKLNKKSNGEEFYLSKVLLQSDDLVTVFSNVDPGFSRDDFVDVKVTVNLESNRIFTSFVDAR